MLEDGGECALAVVGLDWRWCFFGSERECFDGGEEWVMY